MFDHDDRTIASKRRSSNRQGLIFFGNTTTESGPRLGKSGQKIDSDDGEKSSNVLEVCAVTRVSCYCNTHSTQLASHSAHILERP